MDNTSYEVYKKKKNEVLKYLDIKETVYRVYPHKLFCNTKIKNRCITHDDKNFLF